MTKDLEERIEKAEKRLQSYKDDAADARLYYAGEFAKLTAQCNKIAGISDKVSMLGSAVHDIKKNMDNTDNIAKNALVTSEECFGENRRIARFIEEFTGKKIDKYF